MPDLLAHAFLAYGLFTVLSWKYDWISTPYVTAGMAGALIPDLVKVGIVFPSATVESILGVPFSWSPLSRVGGAVICVLIGGVLIAEKNRYKGLLVLSVGTLSHLITDALLIKADGRSFPIFWPLTRWQPPTPGLYLSTQPEPTILTGVFAVIVWRYSLWRDRSEKSPS